MVFLCCPVYVLEAVLRIFPPCRRRGPALASLRAPWCHDGGHHPSVPDL